VQGLHDYTTDQITTD